MRDSLVTSTKSAEGSALSAEHSDRNWCVLHSWPRFLLACALQVVTWLIVCSAIGCGTLRDLSSLLSPTSAPSPPTLSYEPTLAPTLEPSSVFSTSLLSQRPQAYVPDVCQYLRERWDPARSVPGTVVVAIMFHSVQDGNAYRPGDTFIPVEELRRTVRVAQRLGFQTITATQLADFLEHNARIPSRSMIWVVDDRRPDDVEKYYLPVARENEWTITLGWIIGDTDHRRGLWQRMEEMNATGHLDVQSHGYAHHYIVTGTTEEVIRAELFDPIPILEQHFGQKPIAFVWPGGNFTPEAVDTAREADYRLGFTAFSRGPLMYNWIPLGEREQEVDDPLMVLPRLWARPGLAEHLSTAAEIGEAAAVQALEHYPLEAAYYRAVCGSELPHPRRQEKR
jgi:peptidoglycan/xylan/chitin deacetylase (PgdA/CDA1 family)